METNSTAAPTPWTASDDRLAMDSDNDGLRDGIEDSNGNGVVDPGETESI